MGGACLGLLKKVASAVVVWYSLKTSGLRRTLALRVVDRSAINDFHSDAPPNRGYQL